MAATQPNLDFFLYYSLFCGVLCLLEQPSTS